MDPLWFLALLLSSLYSVCPSFVQALRLYPQPPVLIRRSLENDVLGGYPIKRSYLIEPYKNCFWWLATSLYFFIDVLFYDTFFEVVSILFLKWT